MFRFARRSTITPERSEELLTLAGGFARALGKPDEPIGLSGLNPHAGEGRLFGDEDIDVIEPAVPVRAARAERRRTAAGRRADPGGRARRVDPGGGLLSRSGARAVQSGVRRQRRQHHGRPSCRRVSVDHGTAFDIAGRVSRAKTVWCSPVAAQPNYRPAGA